MEWEIEVGVEWGYCRERHGVGKEVRHRSHDVCVGGDIIVTKEGDHMIVVHLDHVITKQRLKLVPKCREK